MKEFFRGLIKRSSFLYQLSRMIQQLRFWYHNTRYSDQDYITQKFNRLQTYALNLDQPKTLNEKIQWLKLHDRKPEYTIYADKYAAREFIAKNFGKELLIPLLFRTTDYREVRAENLPNEPFIIKGNNGFGNSRIIRDKNGVDWDELRMACRTWLDTNYYWFDREWQYKNIPPCIIAEKLLQTREGRIPNDYKLHCINGVVQFVYVSVDREGVNKRNIYSRDWKPLYFTWNRKGKDFSKLRGAEIEPPATFQRMLELAEAVARLFHYVRVDFYDVDGKLYFGEITQFHGGGFDQMVPYEQDLAFGQMIDLNKTI